MFEIKKVKINTKCIATITINVKRSKGASMRVGDKQYKILGHIHHPKQHDKYR
ncbi:MAG: hypothetical protein WC942_03420 [Clostridia bacterium]|jgi:UDP-2,3-diacylglucosamine pyrophosphatase LpxH